MFCKWKNILGEVGKGAHSIRVFNIAIVDVALTILGAWLISHFVKIDKNNTLWNFAIILIGLFVLGIILHRLFCVRTTIDRILFPE